MLHRSMAIRVATGHLSSTLRVDCNRLTTMQSLLSRPASLAAGSSQKCLFRRARLVPGTAGLPCRKSVLARVAAVAPPPPPQAAEAEPERFARNAVRGYERSNTLQRTKPIGVQGIDSSRLESCRMAPMICPRPLLSRFKICALLSPQHAGRRTRGNRWRTLLPTSPS
jgi:hypothetical protein